MSQAIPYEILCLGANNVFVYLFKKLVDSKYGIEITSFESGTALFDEDLYDKAVALPEASAISFEYANSSDRLYGEFTGDTTYSDFEGTVNSSKAKLASTYGWLITSGDSNEYGIFRNYLNDKCIISLNDFTLKPLIKDFTPLFDKLKADYFASQKSVIQDNNGTPGLSASFPDYVSPILMDIVSAENKLQNGLDEFNSKFTDHIHDLNGSKWSTATRNTLYVLWRAALEAYMQVNTYKALINRLDHFDINAGISYSIEPAQLNADGSTIDRTADYKAKNIDAYNNVQAIIYTINPGEDAYSEINNENYIDALLCFQTPDNISYTSQASYESSSPRGSQIPFQYYQNANQTDISFTLKWCNDEVKTLLNNGSTVSLQDIADIAEDFTRPWERDNGSIYPKLCRVVLPGISEIGYISSANITYTGDMAGDLSDKNEYGSGVYGSSLYDPLISESSIAGRKKNIVNYYYNQLEVQFNLIVIKDIKLRQSDPEKLTKYSTTLGDYRTIESDTQEKIGEAVKIASLLESATVSSLEASANLVNATADLMDAVSDYFK